jgi:hypothetical protein
MAGEAIVDWSRLIYLATHTTAELVSGFKHPRTNGTAAVATVVGQWTTLRRFDGAPGGTGALTPTTSTALSNTSNGAWHFTAPATGARKRIAAVTIAVLNAGVLSIHDRLNESGGLNGTTPVSPTPQTTNLPTATLTRHTTGVGVRPWVDIWTAIGATARTIAANSYTNSGGTTGRVGPGRTFGSAGWNNQDRTLPLPLQAGDKGVRVVTNLMLSATTGTAGNYGVVLKKPIVIIPVAAAGMGVTYSFVMKSGGPFDLGVDSDAHLSMDWQAGTTTAPEVNIDMLFVEQ